jgi:hypothetical protein
LTVSLWPEFDRPTTLVIIDGELDPSVALPVELSLRMPASAGTPYAVAVTGEDGDLLEAAYTTAADGDWVRVQFQATAPGFRLEYYDPALAVTGEARSYDLDWTTDYPAADVRVRVQEPVGARALSGQPALAPLGAGPFGLNYHEAALGSLSAGESVALQLSYAKTGDELSSASVDTTASGQEPAAASANPAAPVIPWPALVGGALGLALVGGGLFAYWRSGRAPAARPAAQRGRSRARRAARPTAAAAQPPRAARTGPTRPGPARAAGSAAQAEPDSFCTQCGQRRMAGDRFCRKCGTPVR